MRVHLPVRDVGMLSLRLLPSRGESALIVDFFKKVVEEEWQF